MSAWTSEEIALAREVWQTMFPNAAPEQFMNPLDCGTLPATTVVALRAVRLAMDAVKPRPDFGPVIELIPAEGLWLWECRVGGERCHTGSTFHHAGSAADVAARHVSEKHGPPVSDVTGLPACISVAKLGTRWEWRCGGNGYCPGAGSGGYGSETDALDIAAVHAHDYHGRPAPTRGKGEGDE